MKKRGFSKFKITLIAVTLLFALAVSTLLGSTSAEYFRELSKALDFKAIPDLAMRYYLSDATGGRTGIYADAEHIEQNFSFKAENGNGVKYHIAIPVTEAGSYTLYFFSQIDSESTDTDYTEDLNNPVGCQVVSKGDTNKAGGAYSFGTNTAFRISEETRITEEESKAETEANKTAYRDYMFAAADPVTGKEIKSKRYFEATDDYKWKTVAPSRKENVALTFIVDATDVSAGYVLWIWDFMGLRRPIGQTSVTYTITLDDVSWEKNYEPEAGEAYVDFANMTYKNVAILPTYLSCRDIARIGTSDNSGTYPLKNTTGTVPARYNTTVQGHHVAGITRECGGRGNYVTQASTSGVTLQAEPVYFGYRYNSAYSSELKKDQPWIGSDDEVVERTCGRSGISLDYSNPLVYNIPIMNLKAGTNYKLTFDLSVAKQGRDILDDRDPTNQTETTVNTVKADADYVSNISDFFCSDDATNLGFSSYFYSRNNPVVGYGMETTHNVTSVRGQVKYANKYYDSHVLTNYNKVTQAGLSKATIEAALAKTVVDDVNSPSWYNAVQHTENNGQNEITWLTFENTSVSFNILGKNTAFDSNLNVTASTDFTIGQTVDIYWVWAIDALQPSGWYRIKIDNVRLEEVIDYGSNIGNSGNAGIAIGAPNDTDNENFATLVRNALNNDVDNASVDTANCRGANGTGQTFATRMYDSLSLPKLNVYSPIYDMSDYKVKDESDYKIYLSGYCTVKGGVDRYVWSADGGETWYDMYENANNPPGDDAGGVLAESSKRINPYPYSAGKTSATSPTVTYVTFTEEDETKCDFRGYRIYADISETKYKDQPNLDIIFAAVPFANSNLRCEILRITNFNAMPNYRTYTLEFESDIDVEKNGVLSDLNALFGTDGTAGYTWEGVNCESRIAFTKLYSVNCSSAIDNNTRGYAYRASYSHAYEDIRALFYDFPVRNTLKIRGWAIVEGGVEGYYWSADYGKTWYPCTGTPTTACSWASDIDDQRAAWYDGTTGLDTTLKQNCAFDSRAASGGITANLSAYAGQTIDVIFAAKSNAGGPFCPVARIDNVAVYGAYGSFFTGHEIVEVGTSTNMQLKAYDGKYLNRADSWRNFLADHEITYGKTYDEAYAAGLTRSYQNFNIYEPYHSDYKNMRYEFNSVVQMPSAGQVSLHGFTAFTAHPDDTSYKYKFSLDGGETWYDINQAVVVDNDSPDLTRAQSTDAAYDTLVDYNEYWSGKPALEFNIPPLPVGAVRELLVVVEGTGSGVRHPILRTKIEITAPQNNALGNYLVRYESGDLTNIGVEKSGIITSGGGYSNAYMSLRAPSSTDVFKNTGRLRFTLPVSRVGPYSLNFDFSLGYSSGSTGTPTQNPYVASQIIRDNGVDSYAYSFGQIVTYHSGSAQGTQGLDLLDIVQIENPIGSNTVSHTVYATEEDLTRGYVCWEIDLTQLDPTHGWERDADGNITASQFNNFKYDVSVSNVVWGVYASFAADNDGKATEKVRIPVSEAGSYNLNYSYTMYAHKGVEETSDKGAYFSVPKTVYTYGEDIVVNYNSAGGKDVTVGDHVNSPWLAIVKTYYKVDYYIKWKHVTKDTEGTVTLSPNGTESPQTAVEKYKDLPPGNYKIIFMDGSDADGIKDPSQRLVPEPIVITILPKDAGELFPSGVDPSVTPVVRTGTNGEEIKVDKTFFAVNKVDAINDKSSMPIYYNRGTNDKPWVCISAAGWYLSWTYISSEWGNPGELYVRGLSGNAQDGYGEYHGIPTGQYKIHLMANGASDINGKNLVTPIDIYIFLTNQKEGSVNKTVTVTDEDVAKGYIEIECSTEGWSSGENVYFHTASFNFEMTKN